MAADDAVDETFQIEPENEPSLWEQMPWWLISAIAVLVGELCMHRLVGVVVLCCKFGWDDFRTAIWLRRRDPDRARGAACSWFYWASGFWRTLIWSFMLFPVFVAASLIFQKALKGEFGDEALASAAVGGVCVVLAMVTTVIGAWSAFSNSRRVWLSHELHPMRARNEWPPLWSPKQENLVVAAFVLTSVFAFPLVEMAGAAVIKWHRKVDAAERKILEDNWFIDWLLYGTIPYLIVTLCICKMVSSRISADSPTACWQPMPECRDSIDQGDDQG